MYHKIVIIEKKVKCIVIQNNFVSLCYKIAVRQKAIKLIKNPFSLIQTSNPDDVIGGILFYETNKKKPFLYEITELNNAKHVFPYTPSLRCFLYLCVFCGKPQKAVICVICVICLVNS